MAVEVNSATLLCNLPHCSSGSDHRNVPHYCLLCDRPVFFPWLSQSEPLTPGAARLPDHADFPVPDIDGVNCYGSCHAVYLGTVQD